MKKSKAYKSVWDALSDTPAEAANMQARSDLMHQIRELIRKKKWTQTEAARRCGVTQPRISDLMRGEISLFSLDALVKIAAALGQRVRVDLEAA